MNKRGQFYIILAVIIIVIIAGLVTTANYALKQKKPVKFYDLSEDYESETTKIIDYGVFTQGMTKTQIESTIEGFTTEFLGYAQEKDPNLQLIYIYGDETGITVDNYALSGGNILTSSGSETSITGGSTPVESTISIQYGNKTFTRDVEEKMRNFMDVSQTIDDPGGWVKVEIAGVLHTFDLKSGEAFYYVVATEGNEREIHIEKVDQTGGVA